MRKSFLLYTDIIDSTAMLTDEEFGILLRAVFKYERGEELPNLSPIIEMAFNFIKGTLDRNNDAYNQKVEKCRAAGKKSAEARKKADMVAIDDNMSQPNIVNEPRGTSDVNECQQTLTEPTDVNECQQTLTELTDVNKRKQMPTVNENANENVNESENVCVNETEFYTQKIINEFNNRCNKLATVQRVTSERQNKINKLLTEYSLSEILNVFDMVNKSKLLCGEKQDGYKITFDWIIEVDHFQRILEGSYSNCNNNKPKRNYDEREYDYDELLKVAKSN